MRSDLSPRRLARIGGVLYLIVIVIGVLGEAVVRGRVVVPGDASATAANLETMESLWRLGIAGEYVLLISALALAPILYVLLRPAGRLLALMALAFDVVSVAVEAALSMNLMIALFPLAGAQYLGAFGAEQLHALSTLSVRAHAHGFGIALIFFGVFAILAGMLIFRSGYLPRAVGVLMALAGACYLVNSFGLILSPELAGRLYPLILIPPFVGELTFALWLLVMGVDEAKWRARSTTEAEHPTPVQYANAVTRDVGA